MAYLVQAFGFGLFFLIGPPSSVAAQTVPAFRVETDLVHLTVTVTDKKGKPVSGLSREDFRIYENRVEQSLNHFRHQEMPLTIGLVLDRSGSMRHMIEEVYQAALHALENTGPEDEIFVMTFSDKLDLVQELTHDREAARQSIQELAAQGQTTLYDAVYEATHYIRRGTHPRKVLLVVSDGEDNHSRHTFGELLNAVKESDVIVYSVGMFDRMGPGAWGSRTRRQLEQLAEWTGGRAYFPRSTKECRKEMEKIAQELSRQYGLAYYPLNRKRDGAWREIKIVLPNHTKYVARARRGYFATRE